MESAYTPQRFDYGEHPSQYAELWVPDVRTHAAIAIIIHGGFWRQAYGAEYGRPLARDLRDRGYVVWNLEYRRTNGGDGGWPETFLDVAAGLDGLESALESSGLEPGPRVGIGHSAGGHLALWAAGRHLLPACSPGRASGNPAVPRRRDFPGRGVGSCPGRIPGPERPRGEAPDAVHPRGGSRALEVGGSRRTAFRWASRC